MSQFNDERIKQMHLLLMENLNQDLNARTQEIMLFVEKLEKVRMQERAKDLEDIGTSAQASRGATQGS